MSQGPALDIRELLRLLTEQQATLSRLQRLVIDHVLAESRPGVLVATPSSPIAAAAPTTPEPTTAAVASTTTPAEPVCPDVRQDASYQAPESSPVTSVATVVEGHLGSAETANDDKSQRGAAATEE